MRHLQRRRLRAAAFFVSRHVGLAEPGHFLAGNASCSPSGSRRRFSRKVFRSTRGPPRAGSRRGSRRCQSRVAARRAARRRVAQKSAASLGRRQDLQFFSVARRSAARQRIRRALFGLGARNDLVRMLHAGVRHKARASPRPLFHLWHREHDRAQLAENQRRLEEIIASDRVAARRARSLRMSAAGALAPPLTSRTRRSASSSS